jgi:hypothetical protein
MRNVRAVFCLFCFAEECGGTLRLIFAKNKFELRREATFGGWKR